LLIRVYLRSQKEVCPEIERHVSTQANNTNYATYMFWYRQGASRVVSARELSMREIKEIRAHIPDDLEIETFVHGAMCISYSGRCLLSNFFTRQGCKPWRMHPSVPLEVFSCGRNPSGRIYAGL